MEPFPFLSVPESPMIVLSEWKKAVIVEGDGVLLGLVEYNKHLFVKYCAGAEERKMKIPCLALNTLQICGENRGLRLELCSGPCGREGE